MPIGIILATGGQQEKARGERSVVERVFISSSDHASENARSHGPNLRVDVSGLGARST